MGSPMRMLRKLIGIVFDFDGTLARDSYSSLVEACDLDPEEFHREKIQPLTQSGWEEIPAKFYALIQESNGRPEGKRITRSMIEDFGRNLEPFDGVTDMFERLRGQVRGQDPDIELEYYLVSSGIVDIARNTRIAPNFIGMWGCQLHYNERGEIDFIKRLVSHVDKTRYLRQISRGMHDGERDAPASEVFRDVDATELYLPLNQMIYVGDGASDLPSFGLLAHHSAVTIGIDKSQEVPGWKQAGKIGKHEQLSNLVAPDYAEDSELMRSLNLGVDVIARTIMLRALSS